jgi:hypothetical protein
MDTIRRKRNRAWESFREFIDDVSKDLKEDGLRGVAIGTIVMAIFCFWRAPYSLLQKEKDNNSALEKSQNKINNAGKAEKARRKVIRDHLGDEFLIKLILIQQQSEGGKVRIYPKKDALDSFAYLRIQLMNYVRQEIGPSYWDQLVDTISTPIMPPPNFGNLSPRNQSAWIQCAQTKRGLQELMEKFDYVK